MKWIVIIASLIILFIISGILSSFAVFFKPIQVEFGMTSLLLSNVFVASIFVCILLFFGTRRIIHKFGIRLAVITGVLLSGLGYILMSQSSSFLQMVVFWGIVVGVGIGCGLISVLFILRKHFSASRWLSIVIIVVGAGIIIIPLANRWLLSAYGWRTAFVIIGISSINLLFLMVILLIIDQCIERRSQTFYTEVASSKSRLAVILFAFFFGEFGAHRFYLGKIGTAIAMFLTLGGLGIWSLVDFIMAVSGVMRDREGKLIKGW